MGLLGSSDKKNIPQHIAIIPDGNRRWAKKRGLPVWRGHLAGAKMSKEWLKSALDLDIKYVSLWGGSFENLTKRPKIEVNVLVRIYEQYCRKMIKAKEIHKNQVRVNVFGRWQEVLPKKTSQTFRHLIGATKKYNQRFLNFYIAYNGTDEMIEGVKSIVQKARRKTNLKITGETIKESLWTKDLPPIDFIIRTGSNNDPHNSVGFMMWHTANSQLYFCKEFYPDFGKKAFSSAIKDYQKRERRLGK